ncbi:MAG TPA: hypothetical protein DEQ98_13500 [Acidobacteria bacterium]|nr:hypothetical protein [Acidobacteriota bacterium]
MTWQEPIAALIVGLAVVSLYRHLRGLFGGANADSQASCHGCDDCNSQPDPAPAARPLPSVTGRTH